MFKKKEKAKYSVWQNSAYVLKNAWLRDKVVLRVIVMQILLAVTISTVSIFMPATVVEQITREAPLQTLVITVLIFTITLAMLQSAKNYLDSTAVTRRTGLRSSYGKEIMLKVLTADYANLEKKDFTDARQKARMQTNSNSKSTEQIYYCFTELGINLLGFFIYIALLAAINPIILLITAFTATVGALARQRVNRWQYDNEDKITVLSKKMSYINGVGEQYSMAKDIRLFGMSNWIRDVFDANMKLAFDFSRQVQIRLLIADGVNLLATFGREGIAYAYLIWLVLAGELSIDGFVLLFAAVGGFSIWISGILNEFAALSLHSLNFCRLREFLEYPNKFKGDEGEHIKLDKSIAYSLELRNVSFRYSGAESDTLENINLSIKAGEKLAIVGLNGAGKTTLVKLLCGFYDPTEGEVLLNGKDIRIYNRKQYYALFTAVFQEFNILPNSIIENITQQRYANEKTYSLTDIERVRHCLDLAGIGEKISSLPNGLSSLLLKDVNLDAVELSGGETQKLMLARALYKDSPLLILDEPTAALDPIAESEIYERYDKLSQGRTSIYISHRLASTRFCDRIIMIENKIIAEMGTHKKLMELKGKYAKLFEIQAKYYREGVEF